MAHEGTECRREHPPTSSGNRDLLREFYRAPSVVKHYETLRFNSPFGTLLHHNQIDFIVGNLRKEHAKSVMEVAPGPFRIGRSLGRTFKGVQLDSSREMLSSGRITCIELGYEDNWSFIKGDGRRVPFPSESFEAILAFRFVWHFNRGERTEFLSEFLRTLRPGGRLIFDFPNAKRNERSGCNSSGDPAIPAYQLSKEDLREECEELGYTTVNIKGNMYMATIGKYVSGIHRMGLGPIAVKIIEFNNRAQLGHPDEWLICCERK